MARVRAALRRGQRSPDSGSSTFTFGDVTVDFMARRVRRAGADVRLTPIEYRLDRQRREGAHASQPAS